MHTVYMFFSSSEQLYLESQRLLLPHESTLILAWIGDYIHHEVWDDTIYPFTKLNDEAV